MITQVEKAWMAGVFDEMGKLIRKNNTMRATPQLVIQVEARDELIAQKFSELTGTAPEPKPSRGEYAKRPCKEHCPEPHAHHEDIPWVLPNVTRWATTGIGAAIVLYNLAPYMVQAGEELEEFMLTAMDQAAFAGRGSWKILETIKRLVALGWVLPPQVLENVLATDVPGGKAKATLLGCGHDRLTARPSLPGTKIWCPRCNEYRAVVSRRKRNDDS